MCVCVCDEWAMSHHPQSHKKSDATRRVAYMLTRHRVDGALFDQRVTSVADKYIPQVGMERKEWPFI